MKKLIVALMLSLVMLASGVSAESDAVMFIDPYAYLAEDAVLHEFYSENMLYVDYGDWCVWLECCRYEELGFSEEYFTEVYGTADANTIAWENFDNYYGYNYDETGDYIDCISEGSDVIDGRETVLFNARLIDDYGGGIVTGAIIVENGYVSFLECEAYGGQSLEEMQQRRAGALDSFMSAEDAVNPAVKNAGKPKNISAHKGGPWNRTAGETAEPEPLSYSAGGAYTVSPKDANGCGYVDDDLYIYKDGKYIYSFYTSYEDYGLSRTDMMSEYPADEVDMKLAEAFIALVFSPDQTKNLTFAGTRAFDGGTCVYFNDIGADSSPTSGALLLDSAGILYFECYTNDNSMDSADMDAFLKENLKFIERNNAPLFSD